MRWIVLKCIILACIVTTIATEDTRSKRDIQFWKDLITTKLGLTPATPALRKDVKFFRIPGFERVLVKAVPKTMMQVPVPERSVHANPSLLAIQSYLGTKTPKQTVVALQSVKNLLQSGVLATRQELIELPPPNPPVFILPHFVQQKADCPESRPIQVIQKTVIPMAAPALPVPGPELLRPFPVLPPPMPLFSELSFPRKPLLPEMQPLPPVMALPPPPPLLPITVVPTKYSYKQTNVDGSETSYLSVGNHELVITETGKPLPPPPTYIIDRFQDIISGMPLGVAMTPLPIPMLGSAKPVLDVALPTHTFTEPILPIINKPDNVEVTVKYPPKKKIHEGLINIYEGTKITNPKPEVFANEDSVKAKNISKLRVPSPEFLKSLEHVLDKGPRGTWGYSMKDGKVYYSHLLPGQEALPDPLSSYTDNNENVPQQNLYFIEEDVNNDKFGKPLLSSKFKEELPVKTTVNPDIQPVKKMPPLPTPILGENEDNNIRNIEYSNPLYSSRDDAKNEVVPHLSSTDVTKNNDKGSGYSYTQVNRDGSVKKITGDGKVTEPEIVAEYLKPPVAIVEDKHPLTSSPVLELKGEKPGFSYTQTNRDGVTKIPQVRPVILKPLVPVQSDLAIEDCLHGFSYTQLYRGEATVIKEDRKKQGFIQKTEGVPFVHGAPTVTDVVNPILALGSVNFGKRNPPIIHKVEKIPLLPAVVGLKPSRAPIPVQKPAVKLEVDRLSELNPAFLEPIAPVAVQVSAGKGPVMFAQPVVTNYTYKQISHMNPQPFTVVPVGNQPVIQVPKGEVHVKVNRHQHTKKDGTVYPCTEVHMVPPTDPVVPVEVKGSFEVVPKVSRDYIYIPPNTADAPSPTRHQKVELKKPETYFAYTQASSKIPTKSTSEETTLPPASQTTPLSLSLNPIVVSDDTNYSYTQNHIDGSSVNFKGIKGQVSIDLNEGHSNVFENRGDIPDDLV